MLGLRHSVPHPVFRVNPLLTSDGFKQSEGAEGDVNAEAQRRGQGSEGRAEASRAAVISAALQTPAPALPLSNSSVYPPEELELEAPGLGMRIF